MLAHLLSQQGQFDVSLVFVAVADNDRVALALNGDDGVQLGFGACLYAEVELASVGDDLLDNRLHLVHLDGIYHVVLALVVVLLGGFLETAPRLLDTVVKNIGETQQDRRCDIAQRQLVHHLTQVNLHIVLAGCDKDISLVVDAKIAGAPTVDVVQLTGIVDGPLFHRLNCSFSFSIVIFIFS